MTTQAEDHRSREWDPRSFYERQEELTGVYTGEISEYHRSKAALVGTYCGRSRRVLELGAGGGQIAVATAELGFSVDAVELVPRLAAHARALAAIPSAGRLNVIEDDFYAFAPPGRYGAVAYWDGFGIGTDDDQRALLRRIAAWLTDDGRALIDIYTPWYWKSVAGRETTVGTARRRYGFDSAEQTMIDTWWSTEAPDQQVSQRLRCYAPDELRRLLTPIRLTVQTLLPGGAYDHDRAVYHERVSIEEAMSYTAVIAHAPPET